MPKNGSHVETQRAIAILALALASSVATRANAQGEPGNAYVRMCTGAAQSVPLGSREAAFRRSRAEASRKQARADRSIETQARAALGLAETPHVIAVDLKNFVPELKGEHVLLGDLKAPVSRWWDATLASDGSLRSVVPAERKIVKIVVGFSRQIAAYMLFNDLEGGDTPVPRAGCVAAFTDQLLSVPGVRAEVGAAMTAVPKPDAELESSVRAAWNRTLDAGASGPGATLTRDALAQIGRDPRVTVVYHDPGFPGDGVGPINVVRVGSVARTYVTVGARAPHDFSTSTMCVARDTRCARYYVWP